MNKLFLNQKLQEAERVIGQLMAQNATLKQAIQKYQSQNDRLRAALRALHSPNPLRRVWSALNKRGRADI